MTECKDRQGDLKFNDHTLFWGYRKLINAPELHRFVYLKHQLYHLEDRQGHVNDICI